MARLRAIAIVVAGTDGKDAAIAGERNAEAAVITSGFSIDIATELIPAGAVPLVDARMARTIAIAIVVGGTNGDGAAIAGERNALAALITSGFSVDVGAELGE